MTDVLDVLTLWIDLSNEINRNALSGYQACDLGEMGDNLVHSRSCIYPGFLITLVNY